MDNYEYDFSFIIPVYNCAEYIDQCMESIQKQHYDFNKIQIICVNDGSKDESLKVVQKYERENVIIIDKENSGVSDTRNIGISKAQGKYILFLDADDFISSNTCSEIKRFFDQHYDEIDLVVYPRYEYNNFTHKKKLIPRFDEFKGTNVYDLNENPLLFNPTLNIAVKNLFENNALFSKDIFFHEDEDYVLKIVTKNSFIGYVEEPIYYYRIHPNSTSKLKCNPFYCYEQYVSLFEKAIQKYVKNGKLASYIQFSIYNDVRWRIQQNVFFPRYLNGEEYKKEEKRLLKILSYIEEDIIIYDFTTSIYFKMYLLNFLKQGKFKIEFCNSSYRIYFGEKILFYNNNVELQLVKFQIKSERLSILAIVKTPFELLSDYSIYEEVKYRNQEKPITKEISGQPVELINYDKIHGGINGRFIEVEYDLKDLEKISYFLQIGKYKIPCKLLFGRKVAFNKSLQRYAVKMENNLMVSYPNSKLLLIPFIGDIRNSNICYEDFCKINYISDVILFSQSYNKKNLKTIFLSNLRMLKRNYREYFIHCLPNTKKKIWLYSDYKDVLGESFIQFQYDLQKKDGIYRYYVTDLPSNDAKFSKIGKNIVKRNSLKHKRLFVNASKIIASSYFYGEYEPNFKNQEYFRDKTKYELIVINSYNFNYKNYKNFNHFETIVDKIIVSNELEEKSLIDYYFYQKGQIFICGTPSTKFLKSKEENKILISFEYRDSLIDKADQCKLRMNQLNSSSYYKALKEITSSKKLIALLKKYHLKLDIKISDYFKEFLNEFKLLENDTIHFIEKQPEFCYKMLITDFSPLEYIYLKWNKPVLYYLFDEKELNSSLHLLRDTMTTRVLENLTNNFDDFYNQLEKLVKSNFRNEKTENIYVEMDDSNEKIYKAERES